jgi:hypothetical protein
MAETAALFVKVTKELLEHFKELHADTWFKFFFRRKGILWAALCQVWSLIF